MSEQIHLSVYPLVYPLSVVIPTLNAAATLPATLRSLGAIEDIVVADGGSTDETVRIAAACGARCLTLAPGRGGQLAGGIAAARHPWLLLLHADTRLEPDWQQAVRRHMAEPGRAGYFRFALDSQHWRGRLLQRAVALRCRLFALPYGDQGLLIARDFYRTVGGYGALPLMEDVDLARRIGRARLAALDADAVTAAARYRGRYARRVARNLLCLALYVLGVPPRLLVRVYG